MMSILAYRRRLWILLVPIVNFIFLFLFVFSPSSLPRLPRQFSLFSKASIQQQHQVAERVVEDLPPGTFEHITFQLKDDNPSTSQFNQPPADGSDAVGDEAGGGVPGAGAGAAAEGGVGYNYLLEQRKLVEGIRLKPLPQHLITTYRPGYLLSHSRDKQSLEDNSTDVEEPTSATEGGAVDPPHLHDSQAIFPHPPNHGVSQQQQIQEIPKAGKGESTIKNNAEWRDEEEEEEEEERRINQDPTTKYITFLPHSGFHNQRTELENALLLARLLNRTLIMPKVYLGPPMPWLTFPMLHSRLLYQTKIGLEHCRAIIESQVEFGEDEEDESLDGRMVGGKEEQEEGRDHPQESLSPKPKDAVRLEEPLVLPVPLQESKEVTPDPAGSIIEPETKDGIYVGRGADLPERLATTLDGQQVIPAVIFADMEEAANSRPDSESMNQSMPDTAEAEMEVGEGEDEAEEEEENFQSWIEEPDEEDLDRVRIATGDGDLGNIMDLEEEQEGVEEEEEEEEEEDEGAEGFDQIKDWSQTVGDGEDDEVGNSDFETEQRRQRQRQAGGYDYERDPSSFQLGILDDDEEDEGVDDQDDDFDWRPEYYTLRQQQQKHRYRYGRQKQRQRLHGSPGGEKSGRLLTQQMQMDVEGAALPLYLPAPERPIDQKAATGLRFEKRSTPTGPPLLDPSRLEKRQLAGQYAFQQQQEQPQQQYEPMLSEQQQYHRPPSTAASATAAKKKESSRLMQWSPLPAECLQYESWTMTDWDLFFDLDPLRHYVRILTRESMSMAYLESQFNITFLHPEEPIVASATDAVTVESQDKNSASELKPSTADGDAESDGNEADKEGEGDSTGQSDEGDATEDTESDTGDDSEKPKPPLLRSEADVLFFDDASLYDYRFSESPNATESLKTRSKFVQEFTIDWLAQRPERLIHLGSIFGTGRVAIESLEAKAWLQMIRDHLIIRTEILQTTSQRIADKISGRVEEDVGRNGGGMSEAGEPMEAGFVGIHIRMSDGHFSLTARDTIENIRQELMWQIGMSDPTIAPTAADTMDHAADGGSGGSISGSTPLLAKKQGRLSIEQCRARALNHRRALQEQLLQQQQQQDRERERELGHPLMKSPPSSNQEQQQQPLMQIPTTDSDPTSQPKRRSNGRYTPIYLATDAHRPRSNPIFDRLFATFDCIFTLDDFTEDLEPLTQYRNPEDGTLMTKFLIPMVDAMVVAKAAAFFGTPASTFSNYIQRQLRPAYTGLYD